MELVGGIKSSRTGVDMVYASGQEPRVGDVVQYPGTKKYPDPRTGKVVRIIPDGLQYRTPNMLRVQRNYGGRRPKGANSSDLVNPTTTTLLRCAGCADDGTQMVPDGSGGVEWDICQRCGRVDEIVPASALDDVAF